jgi:hypothetical protein
MGQVLELRRPPAAARTASIPDSDDWPIRIGAVHVLFTSVDETLAAVRIASDLAEALTVSLTLIHLRVVPFALPIDAPVGDSPVETDAFLDRLDSEGLNVSVRVCLCRDVH